MPEESPEPYFSSEHEQRRKHVEEVFERLGNLAAKYARGCHKRQRQHIVREMLEYMLVEFPSERDLPVVNIGHKYFETAVRVNRMEGLPLKKAYELLETIAKKCSNTDSQDSFLVDSRVCDYIENEFPEHPKLRRELKEFYSSVKEDFRVRTA